MTVDAKLFLLILALILFLLATFNTPAKINLGWAGMACLTAAIWFIR